MGFDACVARNAHALGTLRKKARSEAGELASENNKIESRGGPGSDRSLTNREKGKASSNRPTVVVGTTSKTMRLCSQSRGARAADDGHVVAVGSARGARASARAGRRSRARAVPRDPAVAVAFDSRRGSHGASERRERVDRPRARAGRHAEPDDRSRAARGLGARPGRAGGAFAAAARRQSSPRGDPASRRRAPDELEFADDGHPRRGRRRRRAARAARGRERLAGGGERLRDHPRRRRGGGRSVLGEGQTHRRENELARVEPRVVGDGVGDGVSLAAGATRRRRVRRLFPRAHAHEAAARLWRLAARARGRFSRHAREKAREGEGRRDGGAAARRKRRREREFRIRVRGVDGGDPGREERICEDARSERRAVRLLGRERVANEGGSGEGGDGARARRAPGPARGVAAGEERARHGGCGASRRRRRRRGARARGGDLRRGRRG